MRNLTLLRGALPALVAALAACGPDYGKSDDGPDRYNGAVVNDSTGLAFDGKFMPITSTSSTTLRALCNAISAPVALKAAGTPCYPAQIGYARGQAVAFYNVLNGGSAVRTVPTGVTLPPPLFPLKASKFAKAYKPDNCTAGPAFDPVRDAYRLDLQYPIFSELPFATTATNVVVLPLYNLHGAAVKNNGCNDLKSHYSVEAGKYGATASKAPIGLQLWVPIDGAANVQQIGDKPIPTVSGWFNGLQFTFLDGGKVPVDDEGNVIPMEGVVVNPSSSSFANAFDNEAILLPAKPGDAAYSPVVRLWQFDRGSKAAGFYKGICAKGQTDCPENYVKMENTGAGGGFSNPSFNTIFIVATPQ